MDTARLQGHQKWIREELERCVAFWLEHGMDPVNGGVYTCLDRTGEVFSTDKSVWMQGRCGWIFSYLCHLYGVKDEWLAASKSCIDFLEEHCVNHDAAGRLYFTVTAWPTRTITALPAGGSTWSAPAGPTTCIGT